MTTNPEAMPTTVLIVEDNDKNLKLVRDLLRLHGLRTVEAVTGTDGVQLARTELPDVVIMDIQLPDFDGWEALRRIREDPSTRDLVVVAVTAYAVAGDGPRFLSGGFDGYLTKPIDVRSFPETVLGFCNRGASS